MTSLREKLFSGVKERGLSKRRGLGRGLDALLGQVKRVEQTEPTANVLELDIDRLVPGKYQPRVLFSEEALEGLATSIKEQGVLQPLLVRKRAEGGYEILAGERRWRAAQRAKLKQVPAIVKEIDDQAALAIALVENIQREDLNPLESARAIARFVDEFSLTHQEAGRHLGKSRSAISNALRLLELDERVQKLLYEGALTVGHARALLSLPKEEQSLLAQEVITKELTVRETERLAQEARSPEKRRSEGVVERDPNLSALERRLSEQLGIVATIKERGAGRGTLLLQYNSLDELEGVLSQIKGFKKDL